MGSVKDLEVLRPATEEQTGVGRFHFSDRYSVFDWGEMPDPIPRKGEALALMGAFFFEAMEGEGIPHHSKGLVESGTPRKLADLSGPSRVMEVRLVRVVRPRKEGDRYDYGIFRNLSGNFLIPLEVIYRNALPPGSSVYRRVERGELTWEDLGLSGPPEDGRLPHPVLDFSTKLEATDRYLRRDEALEISGLSPEEFTRLEETARALASLISRKLEPLGIENLDGKFEFALDESRNLLVVDVVGTPDECRFSWKGIPLSKEVLRIYYRTTSWYTTLERAKEENREGFRNVVPPPPPLPPSLQEVVAHMYQALANALTGRRFFDVPPIEGVLERLEQELAAFSQEGS